MVLRHDEAVQICTTYQYPEVQHGYAVGLFRHTNSGMDACAIAHRPDCGSLMTFTVTSTHRATGEVESVITVPTEPAAEKLARLTRLAYYGLIVTVLDHRARIAWETGDEAFQWDGYAAKPNDACFHCGKVAGTEVHPRAGWVCSACNDELEGKCNHKPEDCYPIYDGYNIYLATVCEKCEDAVLLRYRSDINTHYECDEPIDYEG